MDTNKSQKIALFACFVSTAGITLTPGALQADTLAYALAGGNAIGTVDLNTGVYTHLRPPQNPSSTLAYPMTTCLETTSLSSTCFRSIRRPAFHKRTYVIQPEPGRLRIDEQCLFLMQRVPHNLYSINPLPAQRP